MGIKISDIDTLNKACGVLNTIAYKINEESFSDTFSMPNDVSVKFFAKCLEQENIISSKKAAAYVSKFTGEAPDVEIFLGPTEQLIFLTGCDEDEDDETLDSLLASCFAALFLHSDSFKMQVEGWLDEHPDEINDSDLLGFNKEEAPKID